MRFCQNLEVCVQTILTHFWTFGVWMLIYPRLFGQILFPRVLFNAQSNPNLALWSQYIKIFPSGHLGCPDGNMAFSTPGGRFVQMGTWPSSPPGPWYVRMSDLTYIEIIRGPPAVQQMVQPPSWYQIRIWGWFAILAWRPAIKLS